MTDYKSISLVVLEKNQDSADFISYERGGELLSNDLSEMRRSSISQESEFVFKTDCGGFTKNAILSQLSFTENMIERIG